MGRSVQRSPADTLLSLFSCGRRYPMFEMMWLLLGTLADIWIAWSMWADAKRAKVRSARHLISPDALRLQSHMLTRSLCASICSSSVTDWVWDVVRLDPPSADQRRSALRSEPGHVSALSLRLL